MAYTGDKKREYQKKWVDKRRRQWIDANGPCNLCGSKEKLEVDHIDRTTKEHNPRQLWSRKASVRDAELKKCQVLCEECHKNKTSKELSEWWKGKPNLAARRITTVCYLLAKGFIEQGMSERAACAKAGMCRGTYSSMKIRGHRREVFGWRGR
jgi:hypothetical protein